MPVIADAIVEGTENFFIALSSSTNSTIADGNATVTITETSLLRTMKQTQLITGFI